MCSRLDGFGLSHEASSDTFVFSNKVPKYDNQMQSGPMRVVEGDHSLKITPVLILAVMWTETPAASFVTTVCRRDQHG